MNDFLKQFAPSVLRYGIALVVMWFGLQQFMQPSQWLAFVPDSVVSMTHLSANTIVFLNACFESIFGLLLLFGWKTRLVALLLALHLFDIMYTVGYGEIGIRDFGLAVGALSVCMNGTDILCIDAAKTFFKQEHPLLFVRTNDPSTVTQQPTGVSTSESVVPHKVIYGKF